MIQSVKKYMKKEWNRDTSEYEIVGVAAYIVTYTEGRKWTVPLAEDNTEYQEVLKWVAEGNTIEEAD